jgi:tRNA(Ile)-lysidine synthetase-like protein
MFSNFPNLAVELNDRKEVISQQFKGVMVAHSGGLDSTALLLSFCDFTKQEKKFPLSVFHMNFGLRGKNSDDDQSFSRDLAAANGLPFICEAISAEERQNRSGESLQEWARRLRYQQFERYAAEGWIIALGHHQDDLAENVLMRLSRGCSVGGMAGMKAWDPPLWRPLLSTSRADIERVAKNSGMSHREDETNAKLDYSRNVIRHQIMPLLERMHPGSSKRMAETALSAAEVMTTSREDLKKKLDGSTDKASIIRMLPRELAHEALVIILDLPPKLRSRQLLDDLRQHLTDKPGQALIISIGDNLQVVIDNNDDIRLEQQKPNAAQTQHSRNLSQVGFAACLAPGSHVSFRFPNRSLGISAHGLSPLIVRGYGASGGKTLRFKDHNRSFRFKNLMQTWNISASERETSFVVEVDNHVSAIAVSGRLLKVSENGEPVEADLPLDFNN